MTRLIRATAKVWQQTAHFFYRYFLTIVRIKDMSIQEFIEILKRLDECGKIFQPTKDMSINKLIEILERFDKDKNISINSKLFKDNYVSFIEE